MKKFSNPFFHSCEKRGRSIGEGNETSVEWNVVEAGSRSLLGAITAGLFYVKHPLSRGAHTDEPLTRTGQKHSRFRRRKWVAHMHTTVEREREAEARRGASFPVSKFPALAIRGARGYTIDPHLPVRSD